MRKGKRIILTLLVLTVLFSFSSCGKKTPLFLKDRAGSSGVAGSSGEDRKNNR